MKQLKIVLAIFVIAATIAVVAPATHQVWAASAPPTCSPALGDCKKVAPACQPPNFLGLKSWYNYLQIAYTTNGSQTECDVSFVLLKNGTQASSIPLVMLAILDDLVRIAGFAAVAYVIIGGVKYITSQGSPEGTKNAQNTIVNAVVGLVIAILAAAIVSFIGRKLAGG